MKSETFSVRVVVSYEEQERLDKYAENLNGKKFIECILLNSHKLERIYHFSNVEMKNAFIHDLPNIFGESIQLV